MAMDAIFNAWLNVVGYDFVALTMTLFVIFELGLTFFEQVDML